MNKVFIGLILLLLCSIGFADTTPFSSFFTETNTTAKDLLGGLFGPISTTITLDNSKPTVIGAMFKEFNNAMLVLAMIIIIYGSVFGIVTTAHEGEFLGRGKNSLWLPLRAVFSVVLLIPNDQGYCILQVVLMWIILQGSGAADEVWNTAVDTFTSEGSIAALSGANPSMTTTQAQTVVQNLYQASVCMQLYSNESTPAGGAKQFAPTPVGEFSVPATSGGTPQFIDYYFTPIGMAKGTCGKFEITNPAYIEANQTTDKGRYLSLSNIYTQLPSILGDVNTAAQTFVQNYPTTPLASTINLSQDVGYITSAISGAQTSYKDESGLNDVTKGIKSLGWIYAGAFYRQMTKSVAGTFKDAISTGDIDTSAVVKAGGSPYDAQAYSSANAAISLGEENLPQINPQDLFSNTGASNPKIVAINVIGDWLVIAFVEAITGGQGLIVDGQVIQSNSDPILNLQTLGERIIMIVEFAWTLILGLLLVSVFISACPGMNPFTMAVFLFWHAAGWFMAVLGMLMVMALMMSVYIPMIPYIIFFFGVVGWIIAVFEAMLSAPLVAMAMADVHHEGAGVWGRASLAFMLIIGVFVRPVFMIFGLVGGMLISRIAIDLLNSAFSFVMLNSANVDFSKYTSGSVSSLSQFFSLSNPVVIWGKDLANADLGIGPLELISYMIIYISIVIVIVNRAFSLINVIPDQVLRWIGGSVQFGQQYGETQELKQAVQGGISQAGQAGSAIGEGITKAGQKRTSEEGRTSAQKGKGGKGGA